MFFSRALTLTRALRTVLCEPWASKSLLFLTLGPYRSLSEREQTLGLGEKGVTTYFSSNCTNEDSDKINRFFKERNIEGYINRVIKTVS